MEKGRDFVEKKKIHHRGKGNIQPSLACVLNVIVNIIKRAEGKPKTNDGLGRQGRKCWILSSEVGNASSSFIGSGN